MAWTYRAVLRAPFAVLGIRVEDDALVGVDILDGRAVPVVPDHPIARLACEQLRAYFDDPHAVFDLPIRLCGTPHRLRVWQALRAISCGSTLSYGELARRLDSAPRAVGGACGANPLPIVVPCHRVVAKHGLGGFMGGAKTRPLAIKRWLLAHEGVKT
ncbi:MAG: methylated-DNA--[protein]-cysteine S-methyltransferase [Burkholderiales bacterium]